MCSSTSTELTDFLSRVLSSCLLYPCLEMVCICFLIVVFNLNYRKRRKPFRLDYSRQGIHLNGKWSFCATTDDNSRSPHRTNTLPSRVNLSHSVNYKFNFNVSGNGEGFPFCICKRSYFCELITRNFLAIYEDIFKYKWYRPCHNCNFELYMYFIFSFRFKWRIEK